MILSQSKVALVYILCGVDLTCSQVDNPDCNLSTPQTADFLTRFDDDCLFPKLDYEFDQALPSMTITLCPLTSS